MPSIRQHSAEASLFNVGASVLARAAALPTPPHERDARAYIFAWFAPQQTLNDLDLAGADAVSPRSIAGDCPLRARQRSSHKFPDGWPVQIGRQFELDATNHVATALAQLFWIWHVHALQKEQSDVARVTHDREDGV